MSAILRDRHDLAQGLCGYYKHFKSLNFSIPKAGISIETNQTAFRGSC